MLSRHLSASGKEKSASRPETEGDATNQRQALLPDESLVEAANGTDAIDVEKKEVILRDGHADGSLK